MRFSLEVRECPPLAARLDKKKEKSEVKTRIGFFGTSATSRLLRRWQYGRVPRENRHDAIDAAPEWSLLMLLEERDDGRVAFLLRDAQRRRAFIISL